MRNDFCVSADKCSELVEAALETISGVGIDVGSGCYKLNTFEVSGEKFDLNFEICRVKTKDDRQKFAIYYTIGYEDGGSQLFCDWEYTEHAHRGELKQLIYDIGNRNFSDDIKKILGLVDVRERDVAVAKATDIVDLTVSKAHCDWIIDQAKELKALFNFNSKDMILTNQTRALACLNTIVDSVSELKLFVEDIEKKPGLDRVIADCERSSSSVSESKVFDKNQENVL